MIRIAFIFILCSITGYAQPAAYHYAMLPSTPGVISPFQDETLAFFSKLAANAVPFDSTQFKAIDTLVRDIKGLSNPGYATSDIRSKLVAIYPRICATAYSHSLNLLNVDSFQTTWYGSPTHDANGVSYDGISQYGDCNIDMSRLPVYSRGGTMYCANLLSFGWQWGSYDAAGNAFGIKLQGAAVVQGLGVNYFYNATVPAITTYSIYTVEVSSSSRADLYNNGSSVFNYTTPTAAPTAGKIFTGAINVIGTASVFCQFTEKYFSLQTALTSTEHARYSAAIAAYQVRISRP